MFNRYEEAYIYFIVVLPVYVIMFSSNYITHKGNKKKKQYLNDL